MKTRATILAQDVAEGDYVEGLPGGFECLPPGVRRPIHDTGGCLFFRCRDGQHYLNADKNGHLVGLVCVKVLH